VCHWSWQTEVLFSPIVEGSYCPKVCMTIARILETQEKPLDILLCGMIWVNLLQETAQLHSVELKSGG